MNVDINSELKAWLESEPKDIDKGISLFQRFSRNRALALYLIRKRDVKKLTYEIEKLSKLKLLKPTAAAKKVSNTSAGDPTGEKNYAKIDRNTLPEDLQEVYDQITEAYKKQRVFHEKMKLATTDQDRAAMRAEVVALDDSIAQGWDKIDAFTKQGPADTSDKNKPDDPAELAKKITAARTAISRGLKDYDESKKPKLIESINTLIALNASVKPETRAKLVELHVIKEDSNLLGK